MDPNSNVVKSSHFGYFWQLLFETCLFVTGCDGILTAKTAKTPLKPLKLTEDWKAFCVKTAKMTSFHDVILSCFDTLHWVGIWPKSVGKWARNA